MNESEVETKLTCNTFEVVWTIIFLRPIFDINEILKCHVSAVKRMLYA